jgi:hypothetical protein
MNLTLILALIAGLLLFGCDAKNMDTVQTQKECPNSDSSVQTLGVEQGNTECIMPCKGLPEYGGQKWIVSSAQCNSDGKITCNCRLVRS